MSREQRPNWQTNDGKYLGCQRTGNCCIELAILCKSLPLTAATTTTTNNNNNNNGGNKNESNRSHNFQQEEQQNIVCAKPENHFGPNLFVANKFACIDASSSQLPIHLDIRLYVYVYICMYISVCAVWATWLKFPFFLFSLQGQHWRLWLRLQILGKSIEVVKSWEKRPQCVSSNVNLLARISRISMVQVTKHKTQNVHSFLDWLRAGLYESTKTSGKSAIKVRFCVRELALTQLVGHILIGTV